jgi:hypothetical protein
MKRHVAHSLKSPDLSRNFFWVIFISWSDILYSISFCFCDDRHNVRRGIVETGFSQTGPNFPLSVLSFDRSSLKREARRFLEKSGENSTR